MISGNFPKAQDSQCFIQSNHPDFLLLIINTIFIQEQSSWYFHLTESPGAVGLEILPGSPLWNSSCSGGFVLAVAEQWGQSPPPCTGCYVHVNVLMVVLTSIPTSRCSKRVFLRTSCPRFEDLQCRSCLQHVNFSKCKCIKFLLNLGVVLYRALGRGRKLDHVLNETPQTQVSLLQQRPVEIFNLHIFIMA